MAATETRSKNTNTSFAALPVHVSNCQNSFVSRTRCSTSDIYMVFLSTVTNSGPLKCSKSNFNPVHVFLYFKSFCLVVLKLILASKLRELEQFENLAANYQLASIKGGNEA